MKKKPQLIPLLNFFAETLRETLEESSLSQAEIARRCGIPAPHLTHCPVLYRPRHYPFQTPSLI